MEPEKETKEPIPFWGEDPNVLINFTYITEFYPVDTMSASQKLNAITRSVLVLTIVGSFFTNAYRLWVIGLFTIAAIWYLHHYQNNVQKEKEAKEMFTNQTVEDIVTRKELPVDLFSTPQPNNPFGNVMLTDYEHAEDKKPAPPAYNERINAKIIDQTKEAILESNPEQPHITNKLFSGLDDDLAFEQSMRPFYTMPSTTLPNDQTAFAEFCYGSMVSCKEGNGFACARNMARHTNV